MLMNRQRFARVMHATDEGGSTGTTDARGGQEAAEGGDQAPEGQQGVNGAGDGTQGAEEGTQGTEGGTVNRYKHNREIGKLNDEIADLKAKLAEAQGKASETSKVAEELKKLKAELADEKLCSKLAAAGCVDAKAAKARLEDFGGDVDKLKAECPYLFKAQEAPKVGSTGGQPATGGVKTTESRIEAAFAKR